MPLHGFFDGQYKSTQRVALGGASRDNGDRAQLLDQARRDRERRSRLRAETRSAIRVQVRPPTPRSRRARAQIPRDSAPSPRARRPAAFPPRHSARATPQPHPPTRYLVSSQAAWRATLDLRAARDAARDAWSRRLASHPADSAALDDAALASLLFFARPDSSADAHLVAAACAAAFPETITDSNANENANDANDANADADADAEDAAGDDFTPTRVRSFAVIRVGVDATETARARLRARRLAAFALTALHAVDRVTSDEAFAAMTRAVLRAVDPEAWRAGGATRDAAETLARATLGDLFVRDGASRSLRALARRASDAVYAANTRDDSTIRANGDSRIAATRRLVGTMCARVVATRADANARVDDRLFPRMLATPRVWSTGAAVETTWRFAAESLADLNISECTSDREFGTARDAGWILANLAEAAPAGIANERCAKGRWRAATTFAEAAADAIAKLPADVVFGRGDGDDATSDEGVSSESDEGESSDDDETARFASARRRSAGAASKSWTKDVDVARRLARLVDPGLLKALVDAAAPGEDASWSGEDASRSGGYAVGSATSPAFGSATSPAFGSATSPAFGSATSPAFGSATSPAFGSATSPASFGASSASSPTTASAATDIGLRAVSSFVAAVSRRLRTGDRGALMSTLAFGTPFIPRAWTAIRTRRESHPQNSLASSDTRWFETLGTFAAAYGTFLLTGDDEEFARLGRPLPAAETSALVTTFRDALWRLLWTDASPDGDDVETPEVFANESAARALARALAQLHDRNGRMRLVAPELFHAPELFRGGGEGNTASVDAFLSEVSCGMVVSGERKRRRRRTRAAELLRRGPSLVPFDARVRWFAAEVARDRAENAGRGGAMEAFGFVPEHHITVTRGRVFEDALRELGPAALKADARAWRDANPGRRPPGSLRGTIRVRFLNEHGVEEAGVDGGGLFKDFLSALVEEAFDPVKTGLFVETPDRTLYPNPASERRAGREHLRKLEFLGAMLGKAVYEGILVDLPLAGFFLAKLRDGRPSELNDLATLDPELYRHLLSLKRLPAEQVEDLFLFFTAADAARGGDCLVELVPGGADLRVTAENRGRYVHLMAHHLLHAQIRRQSAAFVAGFRSLVPPAWVRIFAPAELRLLVSGAGGRVDVENLRRCATYSGGYTEEHPTVRMLWETLAEFTEEQQRSFLKFVTACPNTPLLGFSQLAPSFCVHRSGMRGGSNAPEDAADLERLPTAATCMNLLKLPPYKTKRAIREKLLYAVTSESGFDLS